MGSSLINMIENNREQIVQAWLDEVSELREAHHLDNINDQVFKDKNRKIIDQLMNHFHSYVKGSDEGHTQLVDDLKDSGWPLSFLTQGLQAFRRLLLESYMNTDEEQALHKSFEVDRWFDPVLNKLVKDSVQDWERTVSLQRNALMELSAPLSQIAEGISVMPLIGTIDTERARKIMENLLNGVMEQKAQVVLLDISGVPVVDTLVAHHIIQAAEAVRLVGAKCILVGIRPEIAQTIVSLGIELDFPTKNTLKKGVQMAMELTNRKIVEHDGRSPE